MKTSFKKSLSIFLAVLMLVSAFSVMGAAAAETGKASTGEGTITLDASFCEEAGAASWYAWTWNTETDGRWVQAIGGTSAADITYDASEFGANCIFVRINPTATEPSWEDGVKWNQTGNLTVDNSTFTITGWGEGWGANLEGVWSGDGPDPVDPDPGSYTVKLNPGSAAGAGDWYAWTWVDAGPHWVSGTESDGIITFNEICDNVIFACFSGEPDNKWTGKIGQTDNLTAEDGKTFVINDIGEAEDLTALYYGEWTGGEEVITTAAPEPTETDATQPVTEKPTDPPQPVTDKPTEPVVTQQPITGPDIPTEAPAADADQYLYVSAKSNISEAGANVKINGNTITVSYSLTTLDKIDDGQFSVVYDSSKLSLSPNLNTKASMFPVIKDANYNLGAEPSTASFNFSGINGAYDFTNGGILVNLVFTRKSTTATGTAGVYLKFEDLDSKAVNYVDNYQVKNDNLTFVPSIKDAEVEAPTDEQVATGASQNLTINASSNVSDDVQKIVCDKVNAKVTYRMTVMELIAYGKGVVTYDPSKLALEAKYNSQSSMFTTLNTQTIYNLNAGTGTMMFTFTSADPATQSGTYDFRNGGDIISLIFTVKDGASGDTDVYLELMDLGSFKTDYVSGGQIKPDADNITTNIAIEAQVATTVAPETSEPIATATSDTDPTANPNATTAPEATTAAPATEQPTTVAPTTVAPATKATAATIAPSKVNFSKKPDEKSAVNALEKAKSDADPKGSKFSGLKAKVAKTTQNSNKLTWNKVSGAKKYIVMGNKCGKTGGKFNAFKKLATVKSTSYTQKKLKKNTYYKYVVLAVNSKGKVVSASKVIHVATKGGKNTNYKKLTGNKKKVTIKKGKTFKFKVKKKAKMNKKGKVKNHRKIKFESANAKIATVNSKGKIKGKKKGTTYVYAYAQNGVFAKIKVKVK